MVHGRVKWNEFTPLRTTSAEGQRGADAPHSAGRNSSVQTAGAEPRKIPLSRWRENEGEEAECEGVCPHDPKFALYQSRVLARYLVWDIWVRLQGRYDCRAWWEADGEVKEVRLKRLLVGFGYEED